LDKLTVISLFSGIGGLDYGLTKTGRFEILACVELNKVACATLRQNQPTSTVLNADITTVDFTQVLFQLGRDPRMESIDVVVGGPPCQAFSSVGKRQGVSDPRGKMIWEFLRAIKELTPKLFVMENVCGLQWNGNPKGSTLKQFLRRVPKGYITKYFVVNAADYGAPQTRKRVVVIGTRVGTPCFKEATHGKDRKPYVTLGEAIGYGYGYGYDCKADCEFSEKQVALLAQIPPGSNWRSLPRKLQRQALGAAFGKQAGGMSSFCRRLSFDRPCPTLLGSPRHRSTPLCHPVETRPLNIREYARIQEFPDSWKFHGTVAQQYLNLGNAVPVALGKAIGESILMILGS